ncbi:MAG: hypothetical protein AAF494_09365 [Pseudomonadota bacterium]
MTKGLRILALLSLGLGLTVPAQAETEPENPKLPTGSWTAPCDMAGRAAQCQSTWTLGEVSPSVVVQMYYIRDRETGDILFTGKGVYHVTSESVDGYWEDTSGGLMPITGTWQEGTLDVYWGLLGANAGRSRYVFENGRLGVTNWSLQESGWVEFMPVAYPASADR